MNILSRYVASSLLPATIIVLAGLVALDTVFTFIRELAFLKGNYQAFEALQFSISIAPRRVYEFIPIALLVGSLVGLGLLANNSELIVMRAAGMSIGQIMRATILPALVFIILGSLVGEFIAPVTERYARNERTIAEGGGEALQKSGHWYRDNNEYIHVNQVAPNGDLYGVTIFRLATEGLREGQLQEIIFAEHGRYNGIDWRLENVAQSLPGEAGVEGANTAHMAWQTELDADLLDLDALKPEYLSLRDLHKYTRKMEARGLDADENWLAYWQKILQPLVTFSMIMLAISFIFGPLRSVTMGLRVLAGVLTGLTFKYLQEFVGQLSLVFEFSTLLATLLPIGLCMAVALVLIKKVS